MSADTTVGPYPGAGGEFSIKSGSPESNGVSCVVVGVFEQRQLSLAAELLDNAAAGALSDILRRGDMDGKAGTTLLVHNLPGSLCERVLLVGLGKARTPRQGLRRRRPSGGENPH